MCLLISADIIFVFIILCTNVFEIIIMISFSKGFRFSNCDFEKDFDLEYHDFVHHYSMYGANTLCTNLFRNVHMFHAKLYYTLDTKGLTSSCSLKNDPLALVFAYSIVGEIH